MILAVDWDGEFARLLLAEPQKDIVRVNKLLKLSREELADFLSKEKRNLDIRVCGGIEGSVHKTVLLPPLKKKLIDESVEKETQKIFEEESEYSYEELGQVEDATVGIQTKFFVMGLGRKILEEMASLFSNYKAKSTLFTSYSIAVRTLLEELGELQEKQIVAFVDVSGKRSRILIFKGKDVRITRGLPLGAEEGAGSTERIIRDIRQTILFYTENYPQDKIEKIVLGGNFKPSEFLDSLKKQVDLKIVPLWAEEIFQGSNEELLTFPGCLGLALLQPKKFNFSLIPLSFKEKKKNKRMTAIMVSAFIGVILLILGANLKYSIDWLRLLDNERAVQGEIKKRESELKELAPELISNSVEKQPSWVEFLVELAGVVPEDIKIKTLTVKKAGKKWKGELTGLIPGYDKVDGFYRAEELSILFNQSSTWINPRLERKLDGENLKFKIDLMLKG